MHSSLTLIRTFCSKDCFLSLNKGQSKNINFPSHKHWSRIFERYYNEFGKLKKVLYMKKMDFLISSYALFINL